MLSVILVEFLEQSILQEPGQIIILLSIQRLELSIILVEFLGLYPVSLELSIAPVEFLELFAEHSILQGQGQITILLSIVLFERLGLSITLVVSLLPSMPLVEFLEPLVVLIR